MVVMKRFAALLVMVFGLGVAQTSLADVIYTGWIGNTAVGGYDSVAYFTQGKAVEGKGSLVYKWSGAEWKFSSQENLDKFKANPTKFSPQYGGHCAWAVAAKNDLVKGDPQYWRIVDGKLYLNYDKSVQDKWIKDIPGFIVKADKNWPVLNK